MRTFEYRHGFLRMQRLGPVKFAEQSRWSQRAPKKNGIWAFPYPFFDVFYAYHKYVDLAPKDVRSQRPTDPKWFFYVDENEEEKPLPSGTTIEWNGRDVLGVLPSGEKIEVFISSEFWDKLDNWVNNVGKKILPLSTFWYSGKIYTHLFPNGDAANFSIESDGPVEWIPMDTADFAKLLKKPGTVRGQYGFRADGKPALSSYGSDHLEVFIPRGEGIIRSKL